MSETAEMPAIAFRDPPPVGQRAEALEREIAQLLVRAPTLPIELPLFRMTLLGIRER